MSHQQNLSQQDERVRQAYEAIRLLQNRVTPFVLKTDSVPSKRRTKLSVPATKGSRASYGVIVVGRQQRSANWQGARSTINAIAAKDGFTRLATKNEEQRLRNSARNCNTTQGQYYG
jgi:hypothetical protein